MCTNLLIMCAKRCVIFRHTARMHTTYLFTLPECKLRIYSFSICISRSLLNLFLFSLSLFLSTVRLVNFAYVSTYAKRNYSAVHKTTKWRTRYLNTKWLKTNEEAVCKKILIRTNKARVIDLDRYLDITYVVENKSKSVNNTGRFVMFSVITNICNKKTKGPSLTPRLLMSYIYIYGAPILDVSRSHTTMHRSR